MHQLLNIWLPMLEFEYAPFLLKHIENKIDTRKNEVEHFNLDQSIIFLPLLMFFTNSIISRDNCNIKLLQLFEACTSSSKLVASKYYNVAFATINIAKSNII